MSLTAGQMLQMDWGLLQASPIGLCALDEGQHARSRRLACLVCCGRCTGSSSLARLGVPYYAPLCRVSPPRLPRVLQMYWELLTGSTRTRCAPLCPTMRPIMRGLAASLASCLMGRTSGGLDSDLGPGTGTVTVGPGDAGRHGGPGPGPDPEGRAVRLGVRLATSVPGRRAWTRDHGDPGRKPECSNASECNWPSRPRSLSVSFRHSDGLGHPEPVPVNHGVSSSGVRLSGLSGLSRRIMSLKNIAQLLCHPSWSREPEAAASCGRRPSRARLDGGEPSGQKAHRGRSQRRGAAAKRGRSNEVFARLHGILPPGLTAANRPEERGPFPVRIGRAG